MPGATQSLIEKINHLPPDQMAQAEAFVSSLQERKPLFLSNDETVLLKIIKEMSRNPFRKRLNALREKLRNETITTDEHIELLRLTEQVERRNVDRISALADLARLRGVSLPEVMGQLGIKKPKYD